MNLAGGSGGGPDRMSWQAFEAVRDHSEATGATRTVAFILASYANANGGDVFPSIETIRRGTGARPVKNSKGRQELKGGATAKTVIDARAVAGGERRGPRFRRQQDEPHRIDDPDPRFLAPACPGEGFAQRTHPRWRGFAQRTLRRRRLA